MRQAERVPQLVNRHLACPPLHEPRGRAATPEPVGRDHAGTLRGARDAHHAPVVDVPLGRRQIARHEAQDHGDAGRPLRVEPLDHAVPAKAPPRPIEGRSGHGFRRQHRDLDGEGALDASGDRADHGGIHGTERLDRDSGRDGRRSRRADGNDGEGQADGQGRTQHSWVIGRIP